jgi:ATP-dependent protease HslVU (ClpYQ) ATPase subunit
MVIPTLLFTTQGVIPMRDEMDFIPKNESARIAVERARSIVKKNNAMINTLKKAANIESCEIDTFSVASNFSCEDSYAFDLYKIKSNNGITDFFKDIFGGF